MYSSCFFFSFHTFIFSCPSFFSFTIEFLIRISIFLCFSPFFLIQTILLLTFLPFAYLNVEAAFSDCLDSKFSHTSRELDWDLRSFLARHLRERIEIVRERSEKEHRAKSSDSKNDWMGSAMRIRTCVSSTTHCDAWPTRSLWRHHKEAISVSERVSTRLTAVKVVNNLR